MTTPLRVLIVEDSEDDAQLMLRELRCGGYDPICERVETAEQMQHALKQQDWELILCDYALPGFSAPKALELLTETHLDIPFIVVSGKIGEKTAVEMMRAGAHDYMMKDSLARLTPAVTRELAEAHVRRDHKRAEEEIANLAKFPGEDPDPVLCIAGDGTIIFANKAGKPLLDAWSCQVDQALPKRWAELVAGVLVSGHREDIEIKCDGRTFLVTFAPVVEASYVNLYAHDITGRKQAEEGVRRSHEELRALAARLQAAGEEERTRLARKFHDDVGNSLVAIKMDLAWLNRRLPEVADGPSRPKLRERLESMSKMLAETIQTARETASELRPGVLDDLGLAAAVAWEARQFEERSGVKCTFTSTPEEMELDREQSTAVFRICQELLTNVARHADATLVSIVLKTHDDSLTLEASDNGKGIEKQQVAASTSLGILGMRERALALGGQFSISGTPGKGTTATVKIPLTAPVPAPAKGTQHG